METRIEDCWQGQEGMSNWGLDLYKTPEIEDRNEDEREQHIIYKNEQEKVKYLQLEYSEEQLEKMKNELPEKFRSSTVSMEYYCKWGQLNLIQFIFGKYDISYLLEHLNKLFIISCEYGHLELAKWLYLVDKNTDKKIVLGNMKPWVKDHIIRYCEYVEPDFGLDFDKAFVCASEYEQTEVTEWLLSIKPDIEDINILLLSHKKKEPWESFVTSY